MVDLQGIWEWWHFKEKGDLDPLLRIMESGALAPVVQRMMANDMRQEEPKAHYLAVSTVAASTAGRVACSKPESRSTNGRRSMTSRTPRSRRLLRPA